MRAQVVLLTGLLLAGCVTGGEERPITAASGRTACERLSTYPLDKLDTDRSAMVEYSLCWIERNSAYKVASPPRFWVELSPSQMRDMSLRGGRGTAGAMYRCAEQGVYFPAGADYRDLATQSMMVHELVHHAQCVNHFPQSDACGAEREAYALQAQFIRFATSLMASQLAGAEKLRMRDAADRIEQHAGKACADLGILTWQSLFK